MADGARAILPSLDDSYRGGVCCGSSPLNEICTLFGFYCRFLAYLLACALALATAFHAPTIGLVLACYGGATAGLILLLESSWCCFHHRCLITNFTLLCDSYSLRAGLYALLCGGGVLRCVYARAPPDLLAMYAALGGLAFFFAVAHWERPPSIYAFYLAERARQKARQEMLGDRDTDGSHKKLLSGDAV
eukprot:g1401.t1